MTPEEVQRKADQRNAAMDPSRAREIEWYAGTDGMVYLRDKPSFNRWNTRRIEGQSEADRRAWKAGQERQA